jgi:hypothetical protein
VWHDGDGIFVEFGGRAGAAPRLGARHERRAMRQPRTDVRATAQSEGVAHAACADHSEKPEARSV